MKRIIAFVLLGIVIYAGGYILIAGLQMKSAYQYTEYSNFNSMKSSDFRANMLVRGYTNKLVPYENLSSISVEGYVENKRFFGVKIKSSITFKLYQIEIGHAEKSEDAVYCLIGIPTNDGEMISEADEFRLTQNDKVFEFSGIITDSEELRNMMDGDLIIKRDMSGMIPYIIRVGDYSEMSDATPAIVVGAVVLAVGVLFTVLLILKIRHDIKSY